MFYRLLSFFIKGNKARIYYYNLGFNNKSRLGYNTLVVLYNIVYYLYIY